MIIWLAEYNRRKDSAMASVAAAAGGGRRRALIPLSLRGFAETGARTDAALARAKRQPKGALMRWAKRGLIAAQYNGSRRFFARHPDAVALCWNGLTGSRMAYMTGAQDAGAGRLYAELAPLPGRMTLDPLGVNAENGLPRNPAFYRDWAAADPARAGDGWRALGANMVARPSRRADVGQGDGADLGTAPFLFVPLQVPGDSQIILFSDWVQSLPGFIAALGQAATRLPQGWHLRIKEHPSARASLAEPLAAAVAASGGRVVIDNATDTFAQVAASRGVVTINSSVGLQAFFHDRPVIVTGRAFFALPGLVTPVAGADALGAAFAHADALAFDAPLRAAFMNYLDQVYYPRVSDQDGRWTVDPAGARRKLPEAGGGATPAP